MPHIDAIATVVEDMARTLAFYRLLEFDIPAAADTEGYVTIELDGGVRFAWNTEQIERTFNPGWKRPPVPGRMGIALRCVDTADVDTTFASVVGAGYEAGLEPFDAPWGSRHCRVFDPDGNAIDLFAPLP